LNALDANDLGSRSGGIKMNEKDAAREERILMEAIADANGPEEQAMGWYYYLDDKISFPFTAECIVVNKRTPLELESV
jgi:hypothetical protein